ncbi:hypothetical protein P153DRAFT_367332 [Dothidotthia symphoricarpi CBS 119687]|uniref:Uncharacterized protein n=1 Tax=Dothidotthia symphoricarpi CBS 119687 TaxID=1392245 RepID=A0A6A6ADT2_9PLEO|nr:uncharacterized protein P153DRAFT_367332 [Dothidotthia symphoricarpi CBS 119687]KAF2129047.1 hypothetical protein P153DRAFT_367332 [Dothidotthia symphoricarpi CBS 119687]
MKKAACFQLYRLTESLLDILLPLTILFAALIISLSGLHSDTNNVGSREVSPTLFVT